VGPNEKPVPKNIGIFVGMSLISQIGVKIHAFQGNRPPSWICQLQFWSNSMLDVFPNGKLDPENIGITVGILLISCLRVEKHAFQVWRPPCWNIPVWSHSILVGTKGKPVPENIGIASGISLICGL